MPKDKGGKAGAAPRDKNKVIVVGLPRGFGSAQLEELCEEFGTVYGCHVVGFDEATGESRGYGFVTFGSVNACSAAVEALNKTTIEGRTINVRLVEERDKVRAQRQVAHACLNQPLRGTRRWAGGIRCHPPADAAGLSCPSTAAQSPYSLSFGPGGARRGQGRHKDSGGRAVADHGRGEAERSL